MIVRTLQWTDFPGVADLFFSRFDEIPTNPDLGLPVPPERPTLGEEAEWFGREQKEILEGNRVTVVAEEGGKLLGMATVWRLNSHAEHRHGGELAIHVLPGARGKGIGEQLMNEVLKLCVGKFEMVRLTVWSINERAQKLYRKHGFVECGRLPRAIKRGDRYMDQVMMWRPLPQPSA